MQVNNSSEKNIRCILMDAGIISYKLCTRNFACDDCPLDKEILVRKPSKKKHTHKEYISPNETHLMSVFDQFFLPLQCVPFPENRYYCKNHLWLEQQWEHFYNIGIDDIGVHYLQHINAVSFPERTQHFQLHSPLFSLSHSEGTITMEAPCSGNIISFNTFLCERPILFHSVANNQWVLCVYVDNPETLKETTMSASVAKNYYTTQMEQLRNDFSVMLAQKDARIGTTLHDGGKLIHNLMHIIGSKKYYEMISDLFTL